MSTPPLLPSFQVLYWGVTVSIALFSITVFQAWIYFHNNPDRWPIRSLIALIMLGNVASTGLIGAFGHFYFVRNFGNWDGLTHIPKYTSAEPFISFLSNFGIQLFFASRIRLLNGSWTAPGLIIPTATAAYIGGLLVSIQVLRHDKLVMFHDPYTMMIISIEIGFAMLSDITANICLTLWTITGLKSLKCCMCEMRNVLRGLLLYVITRGFLISATQLAMLIFYLLRPKDLFWVPFHFCLGRVYIITLLSMLNSRTGRERRELDHPHVPPPTKVQRQIVLSTIDIGTVSRDSDPQISRPSEWV